MRKVVPNDGLKEDVERIRNTRRPKRGSLYCPYCESWRIFRIAKDGYKKCEVCGISINDYHVKNYNALWRDGK